MTTTRKAPEEPDHREPSLSVDRRARRASRVLAGVLLVAPFVLVPIAARGLVDHLARGAANDLHKLLEGTLEAQPPSVDHERGSADDLRLGLDLPYVPGIDVLRGMDPEIASLEQSGSKQGNRGLSRPRGGIFVRASVVAAAVRSGSRPSGVPVPARGPRPAGIALSSVGGFGAGLRDGDVLTQVSGAPATSVGVVVGAVAVALRKHAPVITGEVWRGDQRLSVAVEIPTMGAAAPASPPRGRRSPSAR